MDTFVRFDTSYGSFTVDLYNSVAPITVANFLNYVNSGSYNASFFHRLVSGFVLQGGGYRYTDANGAQAIPTNAAITNEYNPSYPDVAGTIAMATVSGNPNSATDQFFFNLVDNSSTLGGSNNGGLAVFGRIVQGFGVVQTIAALPTVNAGSPFDQLPVQNYTSGTITGANLVALNDVVTVSTGTYVWNAGSGDFGVAANWSDVSTGANPAATPPGPADTADFEAPGGTITGTGSAAKIAFDGGAWTIGAQLSTGGTLSPALTIGLAASSAAVTIAAGGTLATQNAVVALGSTLTLAAGVGETVSGTLTDSGLVASAGYLTVGGTLNGTGTLALSGGVADVGTLAGTIISMSGTTDTLRLHALSGASYVAGMQFGDAVDLVGMTGATLSGNTVSVGGGSLVLAAAPSGYAYKLYGDAAGGTDLLLDPTTPPANAVNYTDATTGTSGTVSGDEYSGPVDYLQRQYIWPGSGTDSTAIRANVDNAFLKGGAGADALQAQGGNNVLDGGAGSNFLVGGSGADGGRDTFYVDARDPAQVTWSTIVNFHAGDQATIFGFHPSLSTSPYTASDGTPGFTGVTIHSEIGGAGSGVDASMTFTGISQATANAHFVFSSGTLPGSIDYLLIQYI